MQTNMKYFLILALTCLVVACGRRDDQASSGDARTIEFWHIQTYEPTKPAVEQAVNRCQTKQTGLSIEAQSIKNDDFKLKLKMAIGDNTTPDVFHTWGGGILAADVKYDKVLNLTKLLPASSTERFHPAALDFCRVNGNLYALPVDVTIVPMWYNKTLFAKAGVEVPKTIDEFQRVCTELKAQGITPLALGNSKKWPGAFYFMYFATRAGGTTPIMEQRFEDPAFIEAGQQIQKLVDADCFNAGFNGIDYDEARRLFFNEETAMILMGTWMLAHAQKEAPEILEKLGCFTFPGMSNEKWNRIAIGGVNAGYAVAANTKQRDDCIALLQELTNDDGMKDWAGTGRIPALTRNTATPMLQPATLIAAEILFEAETIQLYYDQYLPPELAAMHKDTTQALFAKTATPQEAAATMAATARRRP